MAYAEQMTNNLFFMGIDELVDIYLLKKELYSFLPRSMQEVYSFLNLPLECYEHPERLHEVFEALVSSVWNGDLRHDVDHGLSTNLLSFNEHGAVPNDHHAVDSEIPDLNFRKTVSDPKEHVRKNQS